MQYYGKSLEALPGVAYPGFRDNRSTLYTKTGFKKKCDTEMYYLVLTNTVIIRTDDRLPSSTGLQSVVSVAFISNVNDWQQLFTLYITTTTATASYL